LSGTIGQHDAGVMAGGSFALAGGFWAAMDAPSICPADIAPAGSGGDGVVGAGDLAELLASWGACPGCPADLAPAGGDGVVDAADLAQLLAGWGACP
jgi:hypothetical protein